MHRHGVRQLAILDFASGRFAPSTATVQRFLCRGCGATRGIETPEVERGSKISRSAAEELARLVLRHGITASAERAGIDKSSLSRLIASRAGNHVDGTRRPEAATLSMVRPGCLAVGDVRSGRTMAFFDGPNDQRLLPWLSTPKPAILLPDEQVAPLALSWLSRFQIVLSQKTFGKLLSPLISKAARRMASYLSPKACSEEECARLFAADPSELSDIDSATLAKLAAPGTPGRHFIKLRDRVQRLHFSCDLDEGRARLETWLSDCKDTWASIFAPVVAFVQAYRPLILSHELALTAPVPAPKLKVHGPTNVLNLRLKSEKPEMKPAPHLEHRPAPAHKPR